MVVACLCTSVRRNFLLAVEAEDWSPWLLRAGELKSWIPAFCYFVSPESPIPTDPVYTQTTPVLPVRLSNIAWLFIIISVVCTPHFIIFCLILFMLLREQGCLLSLYGICFFKTVSLFFGYHHAKEQLAVFSCRCFSSKGVRFRRKLELNCSLVGPELTAVARGSAPTTHLELEETRLRNLR